MSTSYLEPSWTSARDAPSSSWGLRVCLALFTLGISMDSSIGTWLGAGGTQSLATSVALATPLVIPGAWHLVIGGPVRRTPAPFLVITGFVAWCAVSILWARHDALVSIVTRAQLLVFVWMGYQLAHSRRELRAMLLGYVLGCSALVLLTWKNFLSGVFVHWERWAADGFDPNDMAIYVALGIPMATYLALSGPAGRPTRKLWLLYLPLALSGVVLAGSRTGMLATGTVLAAVFFWLSRRSVAATVSMLMLLWVGVMIALPSIPIESWVRIFSLGGELGTGGSVGDRADLWRAGLEVFARHPFVGVGSGGFGHAASPYVIDVAHNTPLSIAVELGTVGLVLFFGAFALATRGVRWSGRNEKALVWCLFITCFIGIQSLTWESRKPTWFLMLIAIVAAGIPPSSEATEER